MKSVKRRLALFLVLIVLLTLPGMQVFAEEIGTETNPVSDEISDTEEITRQETQPNTESGSSTNTEQGGDLSGDVVNSEAENAADNTGGSAEENSAEKVAESEAQLEYVFVDETVVNVPETQNIAIGFKDTSVILEKIVLTYQSYNEGTQLQMEATQILNNTALFTKEYNEGPMEDEFRLIGITYKLAEAEEEHTIQFADEDIQASYRVTMEPEKEEEIVIPEEAVPEVAAYTMDEAGNLVEESGDAISETVEKVLEEAGANESAVEEKAASRMMQYSARSVLGADASTAADAASGVRTASNGDLVVALCAGHDATHSGAAGNGLREEQLTLKVAQYCKAELETYKGVSVYMVRDSEACPHPGMTVSQELTARVDDALRNGADVFIDIHFNSAVAAAHGAEVYYPNANYNPQISQEGKELSLKILAQLEALGLYNRGAKIKDSTLDGADGQYPDGSKADYYTTNYYCKEKGIPGLIVEHAFLSNASEAAKLKDESFLKKLGIADATGIAKQYGLSKTGGGSATSKPGIGSVKITNKNDFNGTFKVVISGVTGESNISKIEVPVWCATNGQDDLTWYTAKKQSNGTYTVDVAVKNHKSQYGTYIADVYIIDKKGVRGTQLGRADAVMSNTKASTNAAKIGTDEKQFKASLVLTNPPTGISKVEFAIWSEKNGQDDLKWYTASKESATTWNATVAVSNHKTYGSYLVHSYVTMTDGTKIFTGTAAFHVTQPTVKGVSVENYNKNAGTFDVVIGGITAPTGVSKIEVPVWCASNQSDIKWYTAAKQADGTYKVSVSTANHKYATGVYQIHTYLTDGLGMRSLVNTKAFTVSLASVEVRAKDSANTESNFALKATNVSSYGNVSNVQFAVWSVSGNQDDLVWYKASQDSQGAWNATVPITNHRTAGVYIVHLYATLPNGGQKMIGTTQFSVTKPSASVTIANMDTGGGSFDIIVSNIKSPSGVSKVQIPVWCAADQSDIKWYDAVKQSNGSYKASVSIANHKYYAGIYKIHTYISTGNGMMVWTNTNYQQVDLPKIKLTVADSAKTEMNYALKASNVGMYGNVSAVQFAVWSLAGDQDDLVWYQGTQDSQGAWNVAVSVARHKTAGTYAVHVYATYTSGSQALVGSGSFTVSQPQATVSIANLNTNKGTFDIIISNITSPSGVTKVQTSVWCAENQSDVKWYDATKQSNGTYKVNVNIANHGYHIGTYKIHTYLSTGNGMTVWTNTNSQQIDLPNIKLTVADHAKTEMNYALKAANVGMFGNVKAVEFAVWSLAGDQDDLVWYQAVQDSQGVWNASVPVTKHKTSGEYAVHVYATYTSGNKSFVGSGGFTVTTPKASVTTSNYNTLTGTFDVLISNIASPSGIMKIQVPVWSKSDQSDVKWYTPVKQSNGTYKFTVDPMDHMNHSGTYKINVQLTTGNGITSLAGSASQIVNIAELYAIMGNSTTSVDQMVRYYKASGANYPSEALEKGGAKDIETFCKLFYEEAAAEGVRAEVAFVQAMKESGWLRFGGIVKVEQFNFCGLGATDVNGEKNSAWFEDVRTGIRAQIQHLKAYASKDALKNTCVDPRFHLVKRGCAPYVQWLGTKENPQGYGWATAQGYGISIVDMIETLKTK